LPIKANRLYQIIDKYQDRLLADWIALQSKATGRRMTVSEEKQLETHSREFLAALQQAVQDGVGSETLTPEWANVRELLGRISANRAVAGYTPMETAVFVFSLKEPLFTYLRSTVDDAQELAEEIWRATMLLDRLGLHTMEVYQKNREEIIARQQQEILELSTPVVSLWDNVLALPLIGTLDSARTQIVMQNLLEAIVQTRSDIAIIDITGVPTVDTLVAQHLLKTVAAARLMGADCIISGIRPQIAQTIIHLGVDLQDVTTKATLADAFAVALRRTGQTVVRTKDGEPTLATR